jgi:hypothetical protein
MHLRLSWLLAFWLILGLVAGVAGPGSSSVLAAPIGGRLPGAVSASQAPSPALVAASASCYTWSFLNNTGDDATGLVIHLKGIPAVTDVYTGAMNPFGPLDPSSGYDPISGVLSLVFSGGTAYNGDLVEIGICAHQPALRLDTVQPAFYWVVAGAPAVPAPLFAGLDFNWIDSNHLQVNLYNEQNTALTADSFTVLAPDATLSLDDLNAGVASTLSLVSDQISTPVDMAGGTSQTFDIFFDQGGVRVPYGAPIVMEAVLSDPADPGNSINLLAQTTQPFQQVYLPLVTK